MRAVLVLGLCLVVGHLSRPCNAQTEGLENADDPELDLTKSYDDYDPQFYPGFHYSYGAQQGLDVHCHGVCTNETGICACFAGWDVLPDCSVEESYTSPVYDCPRGCGHGFCDNGTCVCETDWSGTYCQDPRCPQACNNRKCFCYHGHGGEACETAANAECGNKICVHGECMNYQCVCAFGYEGEDCSLVRCPRDCASHGMCNNGTCICVEGWSGADCGTQVPGGVCPSQCEAHGECTDEGQCTCHEGFGGHDCSFPVCTHGCSEPNGTCLEGTCVCSSPKYSGDKCELDRITNGYRNSHTGQVVCDEGWAGADCTRMRCPSSDGIECSGNGYCSDGVCMCNAGTEGIDCSISPMQGTMSHGVAIRNVTLCMQGFDGPECDGFDCEDHCQHGSCKEAESGFECSCLDGWHGTMCDVQDECVENCSGHGACHAGMCYCFTGWDGPFCSRSACVDECTGRGECFQGECLCMFGWEGERCDTRLCTPECFGMGGQCYNGTCVCRDGWQGVDCACPSHCNTVHATCAEGECQCDDGWGGFGCGQVWCPFNCSGHGSCGEATNGQCVCSLGWQGSSCGTHHCNADCSGHGTCKDDLCECFDGYSGPDCREIPLPDGTHGIIDTNSSMIVCEEGYESVPWNLTRATASASALAGACASRKCEQDCNRNNAQGVCRDGVCVCGRSWTGPACSERRCPNDCNGRGVCDVATSRCICDPGYLRDDCSLFVLPYPAFGRVDMEVVICDPYYLLPDCVTPTCLKNCSGPARGVCESATVPDSLCNCLKPFYGPGCTLVNQTQPRPSPSPFEVVEVSEASEASEAEPEPEPIPGVDPSASPSPSASPVLGTTPEPEEEPEEEEASPSESPSTSLTPTVTPSPSPTASLGSVKTVVDPLTPADEEPAEEPQRVEAEKASVVSEPQQPVTAEAAEEEMEVPEEERDVEAEVIEPEIIPQCPNNCSNHGTCRLDDARESFVCDCDKDYFEKDCSVGPSAPQPTVGGFVQCPRNCSGHGACDDGTCKCEEGWTEADCAVGLCPKGCSGHGECNVDTRKCKCDAGWLGAGCQYQEVWSVRCPGNCYKNGDCREGVCHCYDGWDATYHCQYRLCKNNCTGRTHGKCTKGVCACSLGWTGDDCSERMPAKNNWRAFRMSKAMSPKPKSLPGMVSDGRGGFYLFSGYTYGDGHPVDVWRMDGKRWEQVYGKKQSFRRGTDLARGKPATQSSLGWSGSPSRAVDGVVDGDYSHNHCTHTLQDQEPWWKVDLQGTYAVTRVRVTNRADCCGSRLNGFDVRVGAETWMDSTACGPTASISQGETKDVDCGGREGRFVHVVVRERRDYLTLCGVEVEGYKSTAVPTDQPLGREGHSLVMDHRDTGRIFVFGGITETPLDNSFGLRQRMKQNGEDAGDGPPQNDQMRMKYSDEMWVYDVGRNSWRLPELVTKPSPRTRASMVLDVDRNRMYLFGGSFTDKGNHEFNGDLWIFHVGESRWEEWGGCKDEGGSGNFMSAGGGGGGGGEGGGGGGGASSFLQTSSRVREDNDPGCPEPRHGHTASVFDGKMYMFGGTDLQTYFNDIWIFDPDGDEGKGAWVRKISDFMGPAGREGFCMVQDNTGDIVVAMGWGKKGLLDDVWRYSFEDDEWKDMQPLGDPYTRRVDKKRPKPRERMGCAFDKQKMYLFGGLGANKVFQDTWSYDFSPDYPPVVYTDCSEPLKHLKEPVSGYYWVNFKSSVKAEVYCDMETDGGGWMLVSTQRPDGELSRMGSASFLYEEDVGYNQKASPSLLEAVANLGTTQIMVEENPDRERDTEENLVMVYLLPKGKPLRFDGKDVDVPTVEWHVGSGEYLTVRNNANGNRGGAWWGISVHGSAFNGIPSSERCTNKKDFSKTGGSNGDYKLDHNGAHGGTTRCLHHRVAIGVSHWVRKFDYIYLMRKGFCTWGTGELRTIQTDSAETCFLGCKNNPHCVSLVFNPGKKQCWLRRGYSPTAPCLETDYTYTKLKSEPKGDQDVALGKPSQQSSKGWRGDPSRAVDGVAVPHYGGNHCTHTRRDFEPWWRVDLQENRIVSYVRVLNRADCCASRLSDFEVHVGMFPDWHANPTCGGLNKARKVIGVSCDAMVGRYVHVVIRSRREYLTLCNVQVFAEPQEEPISCDSSEVYYKSSRVRSRPGNLMSLAHAWPSRGTCVNNNPDLGRLHHNRGLCRGGTNRNFGQYFRIRFVEMKGESWSFLYRVDAGWGYVATIDGVKVQESRATYDTFTVDVGFMEKGEHEFEVFNAENCCDGNKGGWAFKRGTNTDWIALTSGNLAGQCAISKAVAMGMNPDGVLAFNFANLGAWDYLRRNMAMTRVQNHLTEYDLQFDIAVLARVSGWSNILHVNSANYPRPPAIWLFPSDTRLHVRVSQRHSINDGCNTGPLSLGQHKVLVSVRGRELRVEVDDQLWCSTTFSGDVVKVSNPPFFLSDPWYRTPAAWVRNVVYGPPGTASEMNAVITRGKNLACGKPATQSSIAYGGIPSRAVDGVPMSHFGHAHCTHTRHENRPWWRVDLQDSAKVHQVAVTNRGDCCGNRMSGFEVRVGNSPSWGQNPRCGGRNPINQGETLTVECFGLKGRYVHLVVPRRTSIQLCGLEVFGEVDAGPSQATMPDRGIKDRHHVDGAANIQFVDPSMRFTRETKVKGWSIFVKRTGAHYLQVWRPPTSSYGCTNPNVMTLVGQTYVDSGRLGEQSVGMGENQFISVMPGDVVGWRHQGRGVVAFDVSGSVTKWRYGNSPGVGGTIEFTGAQTRTYSVRPICDGQC